MKSRTLNNLRFLPVLCFLWLVFTFIISYSVAISLEHVYPLWPYISDTGTIPPESCIFGLLLNIGSMLMALVLYVRYQQIKMNLEMYDGCTKILRKLNLFCLVVGMLAAFGVCIVANFQETSNMTMHLLGANLAFGVGSGYFIVHTIIGFFIHKDQLSLNLLRTMLCILYAISFATTLIFANMSFSEYKVSVKQALLWDPDKPAYDLRLGSTFSEWVLAICQGLYILSFTYDFRNIGYSLNFALMSENKHFTNNLHELA